MTTVESICRVDAPAEQLWATVRDFGDDSWTGVTITVEGTGVGAVRTVAMPTGPVVERCTRLDDDAMVLGYDLLSGNPFPARTQRGIITVRPVDGRHCELAWTSAFDPLPGAGDLTAPVTALLRAAAEALVRHVESS